MNSTTTISRVKLIFIAEVFGLILSMPTKSQVMGSEKIDGPRTNVGNCTQLADPDGWSVAVWEAGHYCIYQNLHQSWPRLRFPHQRVPISPLISIYSDNVTIDLKGHRLSSTTPIRSGVFTNFHGNEALLPTIIANGEITTSTIPAINMVDNWNLGNQRFGRSYPLSSSHGDISQYKPTVFILENLRLESSQHAIIMQGKRNIIRNCTIIGGNGTVNVYGPNLLLEGNTIILNAKIPAKSDGEQPVALYLEDAADSVIRNNKIVIKGSGALNAHAIVLVNSTNVLLEHNTILGTKEVYKLLDAQSSVAAIGNDTR